MTSVREVIAECHALRDAGDLAGAMACLEAFRGNDGFYPRVAMQLAWLKHRTRDWQGARETADEVTRHAPHLMSAWSLRLANRRLDGPDPQGRPPSWPDFVETLRREPEITGRWLQFAVMEALIRERPADWRVIARKAMDGGILLDGEHAVLSRIMGFLEAIAGAAAEIGAEGLTWSIGLERWPEACRIDDGIEGGALRLNTGWFRGLDAGEVLDFTLLTLLIRSLVDLLGLTNFRDMVSQTAPAWIGEPELMAAVVEVGLLNPLREMAGLDPDVRPTGRVMQIAPGDLLVRTGRVELWAMTTWLLDPAGQGDAVERMAARASEAAASNGKFSDRTQWWPRLDAEANAVILSTNAGWYARPGRARHAFEDWAGRYLAAVEAGTLLTEGAEDLQRVAALRPSLAERPLFEWDDAAFRAAVAGRDVVFVTSFAEEMQAHFDSGGLARLWDRAGGWAAPRSLKTVAAPMSIWPFMPDGDWSETYRRLEEATAAAVSDPRETVLIAACGAYGLPLVHALHQRLPGLTAIYNGHLLNSWFGILTNDALVGDLYARVPDPEAWCVVDLEPRYPGLALIDEGRYSADAVPGEG